jgi:tripartite-type tricarboxylate transporter receptor subunit TctC
MVTLVVPAPPGGVLDLFSRALAGSLARTLGQRFLVDNRAGAGGLIAARMVAQARPDGHTLACIHSGFINLHAMDEANGPLKALRPIAKLVRSALVITVRGESPYRSLRELIDAVQRTPARLTYASGGTGSPAHVAVLRLAAIVGQFDAVHVPYKGSPEADLAAAAGDVDFHVGPVGAALPFLRSGRLRALAVTGRERLPTLPDTATGVESGVPEWVIEPWMGMAMPQAAPDQLVDVVADALRRVMAQPEMLEQMQLLVGVPDFTPAAEFAAQIARELAIERAMVTRARPDPVR